MVAEAVTLAHVARPAALAKALDPARYEVHIAQSSRYADLLDESSVSRHEIHSISCEQFTNALAAGKPLYDAETLRGYVEQERELLENIKPDLVVGDFRISLAVSAALAGIPCVTLSNACWSPFVRQHYRVPDLPLSRRLGPSLGQRVFSVGRPVVFAKHCAPMRALRRHFGLPSLGFNLNRVYTHGDYTLYADIPGLYDFAPLPSEHRVIGPILWSPEVQLPQWWHTWDRQKPLVYVTLGSSGNSELLPLVFEAFSGLDAVAIVSTAGVNLPAEAPKNVLHAQYLPGDSAAAASALVICNGGSPTTQQALASGSPVIGIAGNLDQHLNMQTLTRAGVGLCLRSDSVTAEQLRASIKQILSVPRYTAQAESLGRVIAQNNGVEGFQAFLDERIASGAIPVASKSL